MTAHSEEQQETCLPILPLHRAWVAYVTGYWPAGFRPWWHRRPWWHLATMGLSLLGGVTASSVLIRVPKYYPLVLLGWMLTVHAARKAQLVLCHYAVHGTLFRSQRSNRVIAELLSTLLLMQPFDSYYHDHITRHHGRDLATLADPDVQLLLRLGFRPGLSRHTLWHHLYWTLVSPRFHLLMSLMRLRANFFGIPTYRCLLTSGYLVAGGVMLFLTQAWLTFVLAWLIPLFPLYHIAALLQLVSEHRWLYVLGPPTQSGGERTTEKFLADATKLRLGRLTFGRFVGEPLPSPALPLRPWLWAWGRWTMRLLLLHLPSRLCVLPGDLCQHDFHHRHPRGDWSNAAYARQCDLAAGCPGWPESYSERWGLGAAIDEVFEGLASLPPLSASWPSPQDRAKETCRPSAEGVFPEA